MRNFRILVFAVWVTTPRVVHRVGWGSLALLILKALWLDRIPELLSGSYELGVIVQNVLSSMVAAYIFFVISYQLPLVLERIPVAPTIAMLMDQVVHQVTATLHEINFAAHSKDGSASLPSTVTEAFIMDLFSKTDPNSDSSRYNTRTMARASWLGSMMDHSARSVKYIDHLWRYSRLFESEMPALLEAIRFSGHIRSLDDLRDLIGESGRANSDMSAWASAYYRHYQLGLRLQEYGARYRARYAVTGSFSSGYFEGAKLECA